MYVHNLRTRVLSVRVLGRSFDIMLNVEGLIKFATAIARSWIAQ
jgi:hypothetical protein